MICGGICEYSIGLNTLLAFNAAANANINAGVATVPLPLSGVVVIAVSYCLYRETVYLLHILGVVIIVAAIIIIVLSPAPDADSSG